MIKRLITSLAFICLVLGAYAYSNQLKMEFKNGSSIGFSMSSKPNLSFQNHCLVVNKDAKTAFSFEDILIYHLKENGLSEANKRYSDALNIILINDGTLQIQNAHPGSTIALTAINGAVVSKTKVGVDGKVNVNMPSKAGTYTLSAGFQSFKIIRKN